MQSRDYLKKQYEQLGKVLASTVANFLKLKYSTVDIKQDAVNKIDDDLKSLIDDDLDTFESTIEKFPQDILQNLSLLIKEIQKSKTDYKDLDKKLELINTLLVNKHNTLDLNGYF